MQPKGPTCLRTIDFFDSRPCFINWIVLVSWVSLFTVQTNSQILCEEPRLDIHVHLFGDGDSSSGCRLARAITESPSFQVLAKILRLRERAKTLDDPFPAVPLDFAETIGTAEALRLQALPNLIQQDLALKEALGARRASAERAYRLVMHSRDGLSNPARVQSAAKGPAAGAAVETPPDCPRRASGGPRGQERPRPSDRPTGCGVEHRPAAGAGPAAMAGASPALLPSISSRVSPMVKL